MHRLTLPITALAVMLASPCFGHAKLVDSSPARGAELTAAPKVLTLTFNEEVRLAALTLTRDGKAVPVTVERSAPAAKTVVIPVSALTAGAYEIHWSAISADDGHVTKGSFAFTVSGSTPAK